MALPLVQFLAVAGRAVAITLRKWPGLLAAAGFVVTTSFSFSHLVSEVGQTALNLWPLLALACFFVLAREVVKSYFKLQIRKEKKGDGQ